MNEAPKRTRTTVLAPNAGSDRLGFRDIPATGVIFASNEAAKLGWSNGDPDWCNLGQGQAETGPLPGAPPRIQHLELGPSDHNYSPVLGLSDLRAAVADFYNRLFRRGLPSQYTAENVAISNGGRAALTRCVACLDTLNLGHFLPDYTAYEELIESFCQVKPIPILLSRDRAFEFDPKDLAREITGRGLGSVLLSNPSNPTGRLIAGSKLHRWVETGRRLGCTLLLDEFYSHYIWSKPTDENGPIVSAARWVEDVERDPVLLFDGLTKNWRYPGWRLSWTVGPSRIIRSLGNGGSFLDGGPSRPLQNKAIELLDIEATLDETQAIRSAFAPKRQMMLERCARMGLVIDREPDGAFYVFASLRDLANRALREGSEFFRAALSHKVITVPGIHFDVNPGHRRPQRHSRFDQHIRLSYGPRIDIVKTGLDRLERMIRSM